MDKEENNSKEKEIDSIIALFNGLSTARKELQNIRTELKNLNYCHKKEVEKILSAVNSWKCEECNKQNSCTEPVITNSETDIYFQPIGVVSTCFTEKRGTPRQPTICSTAKGKLTIFNTTFNNPSHALDGLSEFSHMWILFYFHRNESNHVRAKVTPPRLNGIRKGVFGTRSPHRPSPIGLSLVHIDSVEETSVYFSGVDMIDGTPVLDIKPYIPQYDNPINLSSNMNITEVEAMENNDKQCMVEIEGREAPDGEECSSDTSTISGRETHAVTEVRVPNWISNSPAGKLTVTYTDRAHTQLIGNVKLEELISNVLQEDPRSVYVRERYTNQFYTFLISKHHVSCKFDDANKVVQVYKIVQACPLQEWNTTLDSIPAT